MLTKKMTRLHRVFESVTRQSTVVLMEYRTEMGPNKKEFDHVGAERSSSNSTVWQLRYLPGGKENVTRNWVDFRIMVGSDAEIKRALADLHHLMAA